MILGCFWASVAPPHRQRRVVLVRGETVLVLGMIVVRVLVEMESRRAARRGEQDEAEQTRDGAMHPIECTEHSLRRQTPTAA